MPVLALASVKGSPGVTVTAMVLAEFWPSRRATLLECDPAGGDVAPELELRPEPGLVGLAASVRHQIQADQLSRFTQRLPGGALGAPAPVGPDQARAAVQALEASSLVTLLAREPGVMVIADCGRLDSESVAGSVPGQASQTLVLVRPRGADLAHLAPRVPALVRELPSFALVLVGRAGYSAREISETLRVPVVGQLPLDRRGAEIVMGGGLGQRRCARLPLVRACRTLAEQVSRSPVLAGAGQPVPQDQAAWSMADQPPKAWMTGRPLRPDQVARP